MHTQYRFCVLVTFAVLAAIILSLSSTLSSFAQQQQQSQLRENITNIPSLKNTTTANTTAANTPVLEKNSDKGIYKVRLLWPLVVADVQKSLQVEIDFLNASSPVGTNSTVPQRENVSVGSGVGTAGNVPSAMDFPLTVKSYDMIIYTSDGKELWKKTDQPGLGGRGSQRIVLNNNYTGPVTIVISNIQPGWVNTGGATTNATASNLTDSVKFNATITR